MSSLIDRIKIKFQNYYNVVIVSIILILIILTLILYHEHYPKKLPLSYLLQILIYLGLFILAAIQTIRDALELYTKKSTIFCKLEDNSTLKLILSGNYGVYDIKISLINSKTDERVERCIYEPLLPQKKPEINIRLENINFD